ncbi:endoribonuclease Dicer, partial [Brachionus plicatilis]
MIRPELFKSPKKIPIFKILLHKISLQNIQQFYAFCTPLKSILINCAIKKLVCQPQMEDSSSEKNPRYKPRPYQLELFEKAMQRDIIIHARTGSGKTFISVMLINHLSNEIEKTYSEGGKRSIFLANTVPL